jgi:hypothetical protein
MISSIDSTKVAYYLRLETEDLTTEEVALLNVMISAAKQYILSYTGLTAAEADTYADFDIVLYVLVQDMYDTRSMYVEKSNINKVVEGILGMHVRNLLY